MELDPKKLLQDCFDVGYLTNDFAIWAIDVAEKQINRRFDIPAYAREEALGVFQLKLVRKWEKLSPEKNPKSYIQAMAYTSLMDEMRKYKKNHAPDKEKEEKNNCDTDKNEHIFFTNLLKEAGINSGNQVNKDQRKVLKNEAIRLYKAGISRRAIAKDLGLGNKTISRWVIDYEKRGNWFFQEKRRGRKKK